MPRQRNIAEFEATAELIKTTARRQMATEGTAALSLRAIARELDLTAPALYRYFGSRDELITALLVDGFDGLAAAMDAAQAALPPDDYRGRMRAVYCAYRDWAQARPIDFQLLYGNPIPGYEAPREVTVPAVVRGFRVPGAVLVEAYHAGALRPPSRDSLPPSMVDALHLVLQAEAVPAPPEVFYLLFAGWTKVHGLVVLELLGHLNSTLGDTGVFFAHELERLLDDLGFR